MILKEPDYEGQSFEDLDYDGNPFNRNNEVDNSFMVRKKVNNGGEDTQTPDYSQTSVPGDIQQILDQVNADDKVGAVEVVIPQEGLPHVQPIHTPSNPSIDVSASFETVIRVVTAEQFMDDVDRIRSFRGTSQIKWYTSPILTSLYAGYNYSTKEAREEEINGLTAYKAQVKANQRFDSAAVFTSRDAFLPTSEARVFEQRYKVGKHQYDYDLLIVAVVKYYTVYLRKVGTNDEYPINAYYKVFTSDKVVRENNSLIDEPSVHNKFYDAVAGLSLGVTLGAGSGLKIGYGGYEISFNQSQLFKTTQQSIEIAPGEIVSVGQKFNVPIEVSGITSDSLQPYVVDIVVSNAAMDYALGVPLQPGETIVALPNDFPTTAITYEGRVMTKNQFVSLGQSRGVSVSRTTYYIRSSKDEEWTAISRARYKEMLASGQINQE